MNLPASICAFIACVVSAVLPAGRGRAQDLARTPAEPKGHIVALGLSDELNVFHSEATRAAAILARHYGRGVAPLVLTNTRTARAASVETLRDALRTVASRMDRDKDVLFVFLTSHGNQQGVAIKAGRRRGVLSPGHLGELLRDTNARRKVLIISACFSGVLHSACGRGDGRRHGSRRGASVLRLRTECHVDLFRTRLLQSGDAEDEQSPRQFRPRSLPRVGAGAPPGIRTVQSANARRRGFPHAPAGCAPKGRRLSRLGSGGTCRSGRGLAPRLATLDAFELVSASRQGPGRASKNPNSLGACRARIRATRGGSNTMAYVATGTAGNDV